MIDAHLKKQGTPYLVGDKVTYADLAFIPWFKNVGTWLFPEFDYKKEYPTFAEWFGKLENREAVKTALAKEAFQKH